MDFCHPEKIGLLYNPYCTFLLVKCNEFYQAQGLSYIYNDHNITLCNERCGKIKYRKITAHDLRILIVESYQTTACTINSFFWQSICKGKNYFALTYVHANYRKHKIEKFRTKSLEFEK